MNTDRRQLADQFGKGLRANRMRSGLSQEELGFRASLHRTEIGLLERGEREPKLNTLVKLMGALGVSLDELCGGASWKREGSGIGGFEFRGTREDWAMSADRPSYAVQFGENVRRQRDRAGISQEDLAFLASVPKTEIDLLERGEREPRLGAVLKLAIALSVSVEALLKEIDLRADRLGGGYFDLPELDHVKD